MPSSTVVNFLQACQQPGCPICRLEQQSVERYLENQFYENVNSPKWRDQLRASLGFCHEHAWLGVDRRLGDALGYSIIYRDLINSILIQMDGEVGSSRNRAGVMSALIPPKRCPACEQRDQVRATYLTVLVKELESAEMIQALQASDGLCLAHLRLTLEQLKNPASAEGLITIHRKKLEALRAELEEFIRKNDYQSFQQGFGTEGDAWLRAIGFVVGSRKNK